MAFVGAGVDGETVGSGVDADEAHFDNAGDGEGAGVTEQGDFVEVDAEVCHVLKRKERRKNRGLYSV